MDARIWVEQKFDSVKWAGNEAMVRCPYHDDSRPSLSLNIEKRVFLCYACGKKGTLRDLGFENGDGSGPTKMKYKPKAQIPIPLAKAKISLASATNNDYTSDHYGTLEKTYSYRLADGGRAFVVCRYLKDGKKDIRPMYFGEDDRWHVGQPLKDGRPLYHLPELLADPAAPVLVVEGEKCAEVPVPGYVLTTWAGGANAVRHTDWSPLKDRNVVVWPDHDEPGIAAAREILEFVQQAKVLGIKDKPQGWGIADAQGEGIDLAAFILETPAYDDKEPRGEEKETQGTPLEIVEPEPWPDRVSGQELLQDVSHLLRRYVVMGAHEAVAVTAWVAFTWVHDSFMISPILCFCSPEKRCGKSTSLSILHRLVRRPLAAVNISPPALFRAVERFYPSLLIDEGDRFLEGDEENIGLLDSGHFRPLARVLRCVGEKQEVRQFKTWAPKAVGIIGTLPGTLQDRSIIISMQRKSQEEQVERLRADREDEAFGILRRKLARWAADNAEALKDIDVDAPQELDDRAADNWRTLLAIAEVAGGEWPRKGREAALALTADRDEQDLGTQLLADVFLIFKKQNQDLLPTKEILDGLLAMEDRPWNEYRRGKPITARGLALLLARYKVRPDRTREVRGYKRADVEAAAVRYKPSQASQASQAREMRGNSVTGNGDDTVTRTVTEHPERMAPVTGVTGVTVPAKAEGRLEL
jgi:putative DNA primase/helicase